MILRILIALFTVMILSLFAYLKPTTFVDSTKDTENIRIMELLDVKIVEYYLNHVDADTTEIVTSRDGLNRVNVASGQVPERLDYDTLLSMGLEKLDVSAFTYERLADDKFNLKYTKIVDHTIVSSKNSGKQLDKVSVIIW